MTVCVVTFPGSNCDADCVHAVDAVAGAGAARRLWYQDTALPADATAVILPGGFSYGDYLRAGAMAALAPLLADVKRFAERGGAVLGICNGFQILCEMGLLDGALMKNRDGRFVCDTVPLVATGGGRGLLGAVAPGARLMLPVAHGEGNFFADDDTLDRLARDEKIALRYADTVDGHGALNGSRRAIAGLFGGPAQNVLGLMPHPERRAELRLGGEDGAPILQALASWGQA